VTARLAAALTALALLAAPAAARADDDPAELFAQAVTLLQGARHLEALALLERVRAARETAAVAFNLAVAQRALGRPLDAIASLERYLRLAGDRIDDARRAEVTERVRELRASVATVTVRVRAPGAVAVTLDGEPYPRARWGVAAPMNPGRHVFRLTGSGLQPLEVARDIPAGATREVDLRPEPVDVVTRLAVTASVPGVEVLVDGLLVAAGPYDARIAPGRHAVEVRARGYAPYAASLDIEPGAAVRVHAPMTPDVPLTGRWWFWTGLSALAVGAVVGVVVAAASGTEAPLCGTTGVCFR
jgi:tetratricopeptide (TPR) repeat protein